MPFVSFSPEIHGDLSPGLRGRKYFVEALTQVHKSEGFMFGLLLQNIVEEGEELHVVQGSLIELSVIYSEAPFSSPFLGPN